jgi:effector-binding domain-containing protein
MENTFQIIETQEHDVVSIRLVTPVTGLPVEIGKAYGEIFAYLAELGVVPDEGPFTAYYNMDMDNLDVEIGVPIGSPLPGRGRIKPGTIPSGKKASMLYKGPYSQMAPAYEKMNELISQSGNIPAGAVYEFYYNSPDEVPESELLTKILFLLK